MLRATLSYLLDFWIREQICAVEGRYKCCLIAVSFVASLVPFGGFLQTIPELLMASLDLVHITTWKFLYCFI